MAIKNILLVPDKKLNMTSEKVEKFDEELKTLGKDLIDTLSAAKNPEGAGLSAPQIGILKRVIVVRKFSYDETGETTKFTDYVLVNPEVTSSSSSTDIRWEACLSIPDTFGKVQRHKQVNIIANDLKGNKVKIKAKGFFARVIQHEIDHLDGILFTSKTIGETKTDKELDDILAE